MSIPGSGSSVVSWGDWKECNISGATHTQVLSGSCTSRASYGLVMVKQGIGSS